MIVILVDEITNRINYSFDFIFGVRGLQYEIVDDYARFEGLEGDKLNYSSFESKVGLTLKPSGLLRENTIWKGELKIYKLDSVEFLSFDGVEDVVASIFYVLTRMEEYDCGQYDEHGRFPYSESILGKYNWIEKVVCDRWAEHLIKDMMNLDFSVSKGQFIPSFDIDNTYAYRLKTGKRKTLSTIKDIVNFDKKRLKERKEVNKGGKDPYDTFDKITEVSKEIGATRVFWLTRGDGSKDRNISIDNDEHKLLIKKISENAEVNIHPSYDSYLNSDQIESEKKDLESITGVDIKSSRQHFLRFQLPNSYRDLLRAGIAHDYSMGFAEHAGFRSGTAIPHKWFDLGQNEVTELTVHPFSYMDGTLLEYMEMSPAESEVKIREIYEEVQCYGGDFIFIWHNETIGDYNKWNGWSRVLDFTLNLRNE